MPEAILGLGSNLGDRAQNIKMAVKAISFLPNTEILASSHFYETPPFMVPDVQNMYVNACIKVFTKLSPHVLLGACLGIEAGLGRERKYRFSPRNIDIDLLLYDSVVSSDDNLTLPHPGIKQRDFVMVPLSDICIDLSFKDFDFSKEYKNSDANRAKIIKL
ncbi:MAG: 2-amino-4-hydroxy-6-hydroxymethyldihydropteridine diphosphokinase [Oscillospiraceae bacterium]|jgi:2-amino-4-hydroxy-6-hydroxymethyldihydropteridine diphosphokinase|nr:2-amino-4-hydroxy-6-hydroxymethyldihydropteridine diphosphokinase [Oscillospiraceae bacterium]